ncbi:MAG: radical SAM protein [Elusimicrobia bacterium]|nr:radical SAM protein [Elusimicrobiota bacterium]
MGEVDTGQGAAEKRHWVRLTRGCNQRCLFCHDRGAQDGAVAEWAALRRDLARGRRRGLRRVVLSGGEPTLHPDYLRIVALARGLGYTHIQTITNGRRFCYPDFLRAAVRAGLSEVTFSLHGHTAALHDRLTRVPGSFVQALAALRAALAVPGLIVSVDVVINRLNLPVLRELLEFYIKVGVREFDLLALVPFGDAWDNRADLFCDFSRPCDLAHLHRALRLARRPDLHIFTNRLRPDYLEGFESLIQSPDKILDEVRGRRHLLARYMGSGRVPGCAGEACPQCFMRDFCKDVALLRRRGRLAAKVGPLCLGEKGSGEVFRRGPKADVPAFADFFVRARFFAKGSACRLCAWEKRCDGMSVRELREKRFSVLKPVRGKRG